MESATILQDALSDLPPFTYHCARSIGDALSQLQQPGACAYAGGTDLIVALRQRAAWVSGINHLVDIKEISEARGITLRNGVLRVGALTTASELATSSLVRRHARALMMAASMTSAPSLRARATIAGNVMTPHPSGDVATALLSLDAEVEFAAESKRVPVADLMASRVALSPGVLILAIHVPVVQHSWYERLARRQAFSRATLAVALAIRSSNEERVALAGVSVRPVLHPAQRIEPATSELVSGLIERARDAMARKGHR